ncbi:LOW QUALITY PROTEIN: zinc finger E-box-binding homeobox 1-like [Boleophthalmus pectinirostris]|uniref:LOW QUALITY PROTEIN: zinc finger E-box-binding homeobox 1-like n=1 Tax=Boleophthalmus pectinirostris TaxID=150288 RepID=UPI00242F525D|nr:LOW QUALITY PROTEIN: zinc finger E-box-binding homeobox 1-like [Boleophthalmus pectinirostris]
MADGPRCKRRKQANPKRSSVPNFNNGLEASSDSDDEDKLHIVEDESQERPRARAALPHNGACNGVKEECVSEEGEEEDGEDEAEEDEGEDGGEEPADGEKDALVEEILQQGDTAIIYPEAPEEERGAAETGGADENGTPDALPLHMCPYCSRGYKRNASLKEHIKYRHETNDDNYSCSHCSYTFTYRSQLERHMSHHRGAKLEPRVNQKKHTPGSGGTRKFKCNECSKAFKYKHHLKEHLRIHSGEKPYECSNCHKRFSHSGSYSSHISSKKCAPAHFPNGLHHPPLKPHQIAASSAHVAIAPARNMDSKPLQEHIPVTQIKTEPVEEDIKPTVVPPVNGINRPAVGTGLPQGVAMVLPTVGLMSPIGINLNDLQNVLGKVLVNGTQGKQGFVVQQPQQQIISLPAFVDHDGTTKIIINYSISPTAATTANTQPASIVVKNSPPVASAVPIAAAAPIPSKTEQSCTSDVQEFPTDLSISKKVKEEPVSEPISDDLGIVISKTESVAEMPKTSDCLLCDECPEHLEAVHLLQHRKAANCEAVDSAALDPSFADLLSEAGVALDEPSPADDVLSVLKSAYSSDSRPSHAALEKLAVKVSIPVEVVQKWFVKMNKGGKKVAAKSLEQAQDLSIKGKVDRIDLDDEEEKEERLESKDDSTTRETPKADGVAIDEPENEESMEESAKEGDAQEADVAMKEPAKENETENVDGNLTAENSDVVTAENAKDLTQENSESLSTSPAPSSPKNEFANHNQNRTGEPSESDSTAEPLDLSLPKSATPELPSETSKETTATEEKSPKDNNNAKSQNPTQTVQLLHNLSKLETTPLNLACISKDQLEPRALYVTTPQSGNSNFVTATQIPTLVAIAGQGTVGCLSAINPTTKQRTILIPQLTYTYAPPAGSSTAGKTVLLNGHKAIKIEKKEKVVSGQKSAPPAGGQENDDSKKRKMGDQGVFPCDLCNKVFQKASSLLRHKYEHTGKRPHECTVCKKAFKHKHHLIEHARLHTGIKPYECDKCGKRFSHSGSYSQHMNHRYSYCKRNPFSSSASVCSSSASSPPAETQDHRYSFSAFSSPAETQGRSNGDSHSPAPTQRSDSQATSEDDDEDEDEDDDDDDEEEEEYEEEAMCVEDIRVVQVDDTDGGEEHARGENDENEESGEEMEVELGEASGADSEENAEARGKNCDTRRRVKAKNAK